MRDKRRAAVKLSFNFNEWALRLLKENVTPRLPHKLNNH